MPAHKILFAIPPYLGDKIEAIRPGKLRSFFAFPYGVLCLASYIKKTTSGAHEIIIIDLNQYSVAQGLAQFAEVLNEFEPDIVGISVMFDVAIRHVAETRTPAQSALGFMILWLGLLSGPKTNCQFQVAIGESPADWFLATQRLPGAAWAPPSWKSAQQPSKGTLAHFESVFAGDVSLARLRR